MGHPVKRPKRNSRPPGSNYGWVPFRTPEQIDRDEREKRDRLVAEFIASRGVTRLPCLYRPLP